MVPNFGYVVQREMTKSQIFLRSESGHDSRVFPAKKQISDWLTYLVYQLEACFLAGNHLNSCPDVDLRKNWL